MTHTTHDVASLLRRMLTETLHTASTCEGFNGRNDRFVLAQHGEEMVQLIDEADIGSVSSFDQADIATTKAGLVIRTADGDTFHVTVTKGAKA